MKTSIKMLLITLLIWVIFLCVFISFKYYFPYFLTSITLYALLSLFSSITIFFIFQYLFFQPLNKFIQNINTSAQKNTVVTLKHEIEELSKHLDEINKKITQYDSEEKRQPILSYKKDDMHYDPLTSLPNYTFFNEILYKIISNGVRNGKSLVLLIVNIDNFKLTNQNYSETVGNEILREISLRITHILRAGDIISRHKDDEFIILLNDIAHPKFAGQVAEKILQSISKPISIAADTISIHASIGISSFPNDSQTIDELKNNALLALQKAKKLGGNGYQFFSADLNTQAHNYIQLESGLRKAIKNNELILYFQPQLNLQECKVKSVEALLRWNHPELGLIYPDKFIALAEESGLIMELGEWAIYEACRYAKEWQENGYDPITVAVNISPKQFQNQDISHIVKTALNKTQLNPSCLEVEITETIIMDNLERTIKKLQALNAMGVSISIDDFGTGYTSLNYLRQFPVQLLKIDKSFITHSSNNYNDRAIITALISLGHHLGLKIIAEGIENAEQLQFLVDQGCDLIQGDFFSPALPPNEIIAKFTKN